MFANDEGTEIAGVQIHPDADSMRSHMQVMREAQVLTAEQGLRAVALEAAWALGETQDP